MQAHLPNPAAGSGPAADRIAVRAADAADVPSVLALLATAGLPLDGAGAAFIHGVVADLGGAVVGAAAVERYGTDGLLRSVVVREDLRGTGLGRALVAASEERAADLGVRHLYLLTETAANWFPRLGYAAFERTAAPAGIAGSWEFRFACAERGVLMHRALGD
jgi:N-acetylglutamate synthase-like GNAT family acetyltransferase